jgi:hypothetical protein
MPSALRLTLPLTALLILASGCGGDARSEVTASPEEQVLLGQLTRDNFVEIIDLERTDLEHLVVTTRQGSNRIRYVIKPARPGDAALMLHRINDRAMIEVSESDQLGTGPQPGASGRYR